MLKLFTVFLLGLYSDLNQTNSVRGKSHYCSEQLSVWVHNMELCKHFRLLVQQFAMQLKLHH
jgi:hypothetical protein